MTLAAVTRTIQFILAPVVMVSTCAILLGNLMSRYAIVNDRLRTLAQEHRALTLAGVPAGGPPQEGRTADRDRRLQEIDAQLPNLLHRHRQLRRSVVMLNYAILVFFLDMLVIALAALETSVGWVTFLALLNFVVGIACTAWSVVLSTLEASTSHLAVEHDLSWLASTATGSTQIDAHGEAHPLAAVPSWLRRNNSTRS